MQKPMVYFSHDFTTNQHSWLSNACTEADKNSRQPAPGETESKQDKDLVSSGLIHVTFDLACILNQIMHALVFQCCLLR